MSNIDKLRAYLDKTGRRIGGISRGEKACTAEELAEELLKVLESVDRGEYEPSHPERDEDCDLTGLTPWQVESHKERWRRYHEEVAERDRIRDAWLASQGEQK